MVRSGTDKELAAAPPDVQRPMLYVGNVPPNTSPAEFLSTINGFLDRRSHLKSRPPCQALECRGRMDPNSKRGGRTSFKGFFFLTFQSDEDARWALAGLNGLEYRGRKLRAEPKRKRNDDTTRGRRTGRDTAVDDLCGIEVAIEKFTIEKFEEITEASCGFCSEEGDDDVWQLYICGIRGSPDPPVLLSTINAALSNVADGGASTGAMACRVKNGNALVKFTSKRDAMEAMSMLMGTKLKVPRPPVLASKNEKDGNHQVSINSSNHSENSNEQTTQGDGIDQNGSVAEEPTVDNGASDPIVAFEGAFAKFVRETKKKEDRRQEETNQLKNEVKRLRAERKKTSCDVSAKQEKQPSSTADVGMAKEIHRLKSELGKVRSELWRSSERLDLERHVALTSKDRMQIVFSELDALKETVKIGDEQIARLSSKILQYRAEKVRARQAQSDATAERKQWESTEKDLKRQIKELETLCQGRILDDDVELRNERNSLMRKVLSLQTELKEAQTLTEKLLKDSQVLAEKTKHDLQAADDGVKEKERQSEGKFALITQSKEATCANSKIEETSQLRSLLANAEAQVIHLETKLAQANKRVEKAKEDFMNANDQVIGEKIKREAAEKKLKKKLVEIKEAKQKEAQKKSTQGLSASAKPPPEARSLGLYLGLDTSRPSKRKNDGLQVLLPGQPNAAASSRESHIASLIHFEAAHRDKRSDSARVSSSNKEAEERRQAELELIASSFSDEEVHITRGHSSTATIIRHLSLSVREGAIPVDIEINTSDIYLYSPDCKVEVKASVPSPSETVLAGIRIAGAAEERAIADQSLPKLLASCRWEAELTKGEESVFGVLVAADNWARNEWPSMLPNEQTDGEANTTPAHASEESPSYNFGRMLIYSHHIYDPDKLKHVTKLATNYHLGGIVKIGTPAFVLVEGLEENCQSYAEDLIQYRTKMSEGRQSGKRDSATFSVLDKSSCKVNGIEAIVELLILPSKMKEIKNDMIDELKSACSASGFDKAFEEYLSN